MTYPPGTIIRYSAASRINHWITGGCFVLLVLSGLSMFHPMLFFLSGLFGGGQWTRAVHPWIGSVLFVSYAGLIVQFWRDEMWTRDDLVWSKAITHVLVNEEEGVPEVARFNAGQKFVFMGDGSPGAGAFLERSCHLGSLLFILHDNRAAADRLIDS